MVGEAVVGGEGFCFVAVLFDAVALDEAAEGGLAGVEAPAVRGGELDDGEDVGVWVGEEEFVEGGLAFGGKLVEGAQRALGSLEGGEDLLLWGR